MLKRTCIEVFNNKLHSMIRIIDNIDALRNFQDDWNEIYSNSINPTPFQAYDYVYNAWDYVSNHAKQLHIIVYIRQKDKAVLGVAPCYVDNKNALRFINDIHTDFCDIIVRSDAIADYHMWSEISDSILSCNSIKRVNLINLRPKSYLTSNLRYFLSPSFVYSNNAYTCCTLSHIDASQPVTDALMFLRSKERARLKNVYTKINADQLCVYDVHKGESFPSQLVTDVIKQMVDSGWRTYQYFNESMIMLFRSLYDAGLLQIHLTKKDNSILAANFWLYDKGNTEYIDWIAIYTDKERNLDNLLQSIHYIAQQGGMVNFGRGTYKYKMHNFRPQIYNLYTLRWSKSLWGQIGDLFAMNLYHIKQIIKKIIRK